MRVNKNIASRQVVVFGLLKVRPRPQRPPDRARVRLLFNTAAQVLHLVFSIAPCPCNRLTRVSASSRSVLALQKSIARDAVHGRLATLGMPTGQGLDAWALVAAPGLNLTSWRLVYTLKNGHFEEMKSLLPATAMMQQPRAGPSIPRLFASVYRQRRILQMSRMVRPTKCAATCQDVVRWMGIDTRPKYGKTWEEQLRLRHTCSRATMPGCHAGAIRRNHQDSGRSVPLRGQRKRHVEPLRLTSINERRPLC